MINWRILNIDFMGEYRAVRASEFYLNFGVLSLSDPRNMGVRITNITFPPHKKRGQPRKASPHKKRKRKG